MQALLSNKENFSVINTLSSANPKHGPIPAAKKEANYSSQKQHNIILPVMFSSDREMPYFNLRGPDKSAYAGFVNGKSIYKRKVPGGHILSGENQLSAITQQLHTAV